MTNTTNSSSIHNTQWNKNIYKKTWTSPCTAWNRGLFNEYLPHEDYIVEGEVIATRAKTPIFQNILHESEKTQYWWSYGTSPSKSFPLWFVILHSSDDDEPLLKRRKKLEEIVNTTPDEINLSNMVYGTPDTVKEVENLFELSLAQHHEGIMIKDAGEPYIPGLRGKKMLKYKAEPETLDMVVVGGTYGIGKRGDFVGSYLVSLHWDNNLKTVAYVATGLDDATLEYLAKKWKNELSTKGREIVVEPKIILEVAFSEMLKVLNMKPDTHCVSLLLKISEKTKNR